MVTRKSRSEIERMRQADDDHPIERVGRTLRAMMPWSEEGGQAGGGTGGQSTAVAEPGVRAEQPPARPPARLPA